MSNTFRYANGDTKPVVAAVDSATVIEIGDLLYLDTDDAKPASSFTWNNTLAETQDSFADSFLGVAMQQSRSGDTDPIRVATAGRFRFACASATFELGNLIGPAKASGNALEDQEVAVVTDPARAIAVVAQRESSAVTEVLVDITSNVLYGGIAGNTAST